VVAAVGLFALSTVLDKAAYRGDLRVVLDEYAAHYNRHHPHRARNLRPPDEGDGITARPPTWRRPGYDASGFSAG
jgi:hypothetical protein